MDKYDINSSSSISVIGRAWRTELEIRKFLDHARGFDLEFYLKKKIERINEFFDTEHLDSCVIGLSGGIDSSLVLGLLNLASKEPCSPIKKIRGITLPIFNIGATGQREALRKFELLKSYPSLQNEKIEFLEKDLTQVQESYLRLEEGHYSPFAAGQLLSIIRIPFLYFHAALLQDQNYRSIVVGTTNRDEGAYLGFYGKASDGMVDLQPIADLHKNEIFEIAKSIKIPEEIICAEPTGDVFDGRTDQEMIGANYEDIRFFILLKDFGLDFRKMIQLLSSDTIRSFENIEALHKKNLHKYKVGLPSRFVDVMKRVVEGGWS
ncbi:NAD+ synthetase [Leptospira weilii serovar Ranarum str. ICFT]|uniref:NH(3)-dependent NAD(+) synthetase n=1 Tax=Leptospira weilii serovar Ranarum str. ICFT TaxID=1218598 RepID=N1WIR3_9LEPT|nr:NAD(+) synthase [Leptospira weilii]EMY76964.1 NAD+ synthetase [Leptospira weilii serovar Ranarum str. ICFT]